MPESKEADARPGTVEHRPSAVIGYLKPARERVDYVSPPTRRSSGDVLGGTILKRLDATGLTSKHYTGLSLLG